jgi:arylsulfatase A-like enzyme
MPETQHAGTVVDGFVQHQDIMPTLLGLVEQTVPERCNGQNFWPLVTKHQPIDLRDIIVSGFGWYASVRTADWNYQAPWAEADNRRPPELYNRKIDPDELTNVIDDHPNVATELQAHLDEVMETTPLTEGQLSQISETDTPAAVPGVKW